MDCHVNADCVDIVGDYKCHCTTGYTGNGTHCSGQEEIYETKLMCVPCFDWDSSFFRYFT